MRGGEKVLAALCEVLPDADLFTHAYDPAAVPDFARFKVTESFIARLPFGRRIPQAYLPFMPCASRSFGLEGYDLIVSSESGPIKGVRKPHRARHICYCHTPMRYVWDMYAEYYSASGPAGKAAMKLFTPYMRREDLKSAESVDTFVANSAFVAERIRRVYGRESAVVHPPVDTAFFSSSARAPRTVRFEPGSYYLYAGELRAYKRPDLALDACLKMNRRLVVVGNGSMREALSRKAGGRDDVVFTGRVPDDELHALYAGAKALLFPGVEDFGIVPVEAQASGTPVVAFGRGGALETVVDGETGCFFDSEGVERLCGAIEAFESRTWSSAMCRENAARFSQDRFRAEISSVILGDF